MISEDDAGISCFQQYPAEGFIQKVVTKRGNAKRALHFALFRREPADASVADENLPDIP